jgi:IclR family acetate operon transcriptional repressor
VAGSIAHEAFFASRAMHALEVLVFGPATVTQLAAELGVHTRTARRLLNRMVYDGWLTRRPGPRPTYTPTLRILALAAQHAHRHPLLHHARTLAGELHATTGEAVHLAIPSYRSTLRLLRAGPSGSQIAGAGDLAPAHSTAAGKLLLAHRAPWRDAVLAARLVAMTPRTITDPASIRADLDRVLARGYALEGEEHCVGVCAIAVPVRTTTGEVLAALALSTSSEVTALTGYRDTLTATAHELAARAQLA